MKKLITLAVALMAFSLPATAAETYCSTIAVTMTTEAGATIDGPTNTASSVTCGLDHAQLTAHHYLMTGALGAALVAAAKAVLDGDDTDNEDAMIRALSD